MVVFGSIQMLFYMLSFLCMYMCSLYARADIQILVLWTLQPGYSDTCAVDTTSYLKLIIVFFNHFNVDNILFNISMILLSNARHFPPTYISIALFLHSHEFCSLFCLFDYLILFFLLLHRTI